MRAKLTYLAVLLPIVLLLAQTAQGQYCAASGGCDEYISNVTLGTINNSSACSNYADYTTISTTVVPGLSYPITVTNGNPWSLDECGIWVDWNQNGNFYDDTPIAVTGNPGYGPYTATITVPPTALPGNTRMRVRIVYNQTPDPCGTTSFGEAEDYTLTVASSLAVDAGVIGISEPTNPNAPGLQNVSAVLMNFGSDTLSSVNFDYEVDGLPGSTFAWTGSLPNLAVDTVTIGTTTLANGVHHVKVWTSMPNAAVDSFNLNDTAEVNVITCNPYSGTYTVGGTGADFPDLAIAADALANCGITGPVTLNVQPGTYNGQVTFYEVPGTSATNRVTVQSSTGNASDVTLSYNAGSGDNWTLAFDGADYITLQNLTLTADDSSYARVILITGGADYNQILNNVIISQPFARTNGNAYGIFDDGTIDNYNIISNNEIWNGYYGIYSYGESTANLQQGTIIEDNIVQDFFYYGIYLYYHDAPIMSGNEVENHSSSGYTYGISCSYCDNELEITANKVNIVGTSYQYGLRVYYSDATDSTMGLVANNMVSITGNSSGYCRGGYFYYSNYQMYYNNSFHVTTGSTSYGAYIYQGGNNHSINNLFSDINGGYSLYVSGSPLLLSNYNNYYSTGTTLAYWGTAVSDLVALQTASGQDLNSVNIDPQFYLPDMLYPGSVALDNLGTPLTEVPDDIDGNVRSLTTPDIGCVEFTPPQDDAGVVSIDQPGTPLSPGSYPVAATLKNFGLSNLTTCNLNFSVNGGPVTTYLWVGNISPGSTAGPSTIGNHTFGYGTHELKVWTSDPNLQLDGNAINDTMVMYVTVCDIMDTIYTIGDSAMGADYYSFNDAINAMTNCGIGGQVIFNVMPGTYNEQVSIPEIPGASLTNSVTFQSSTGNPGDVVLHYSPSLYGAEHVLAFDGADYVTFQNMTIQVDSGSSYGYAVVLKNEANYNSIIGNDINSLLASSSSFAGIYSPSSQDEFNIVSANNINGGYYGIYFYGPSGTFELGNIIDGNSIEDYYYYGIYFYYQNAPIVNDNYIHNSPQSGYCYGIRCYYSSGPQQITKNRIILDGGGYNYPMYMYYNDATANDPALIANNFFAQLNPASSGSYTYIYNSQYQRFYHNSFSTHCSSGTSRNLYISGSGAMGNEYVNNIMANYGYGQTVYLGSSSYTSGISWMDYNAFYTNGSTLCYAGTSYPDLASWQAFSGTDSLSVEGDPNFSTPTLLYPTSAVINDIATPLSAVSEDIDGNPRSLTTPDPGAVEFVPPANDMAIIAIHSPMLSACGLGQNEVFSVSIYNNGLGVQSGIQMTYSIDGGTTFVTPEFVSSSMNPGDTLVFSFNQTADMSTYGLYDCIIAVTAPGDANPLNDSLMVTIENVQPISSFPYAQDFETFIPGAPGTFMDGWVADPASGFRWQVNTGSTSSTNTGAANDHTTGSGVYVYTEASSGSSGDVATLTSKCIDMSSLTAPELRFWYHMWGPDFNHFAVDVLDGGTWVLDLFTITAQTHSSASDPWLEAIVPLVNYAAADKIRFRVIRGGSYGGDVCIDDVKIQEAPQFEGEMLGFTGPMGGCDLGNEIVSVMVTNKGAQTIQGNMQASYHVHGAASPVTETIPDTIMVGDTLEYFFTTPINMVVSADSIFNLTGYIDLPGDPDPTNDTAYWSLSSRLSSPPPLVSNQTVTYGSSATLVATSTGANQVFKWYDSLASTANIGIGDTFLTPPLYNTTVYWVESEWGFPMSNTMFGPGTVMNNYVPCYGWYDYSWSKTIYTSSELNFSGTIDTISFFLQNTPSPNPYTMLTQKIWLGHTTDVEFANTNYMDTTVMTKVYEGDVSWGGPGEMKIALDQSFNYNGNDNLVMYYENWDGSYVSGEPEFNAVATTLDQCAYDYQDNSFPYMAGTFISSKPDMGFYGSLISGGNGCPSARVADTVFVTAPVVTVDAGNDTSICLGDSVQMNITVSGGVTPYNYAWSPAGSLNNANLANPTATPITNTTYSVTVTDQNGDSGTDDIIVLVNPGPNVNLANIPDICINYAPYTLVEGTPAGGVYSGPGVSGGMFDPAVAGQGTHTITYTYTDPATGCGGSATNTVFVDLCTGLENITNGLGLAVYPNPTSGMVLLTLFSEASDISLDLMDVTGKIIMEEKLINTKGLMTHELDLSRLPQGVYYIRLLDDEHSKAVKVVKH